ncbi:hypothetical protein FQR65_LT14567 [Abscondita terminalis]|nr:hypothetical protein FQR65_LT14567 [Abscondita terminalis]
MTWVCCCAKAEVVLGKAADTLNKLVSKAISRNRFEFIMSHLHFVDNNILNNSDKFAKVRPLFDHLNKKFIGMSPLQENHYVDESMVPYYGRHGCKQYIHGKPIRSYSTAFCGQIFNQREKNIQIDQPHLVNLYNQNMGGVDRCDENLSLYRASIRGKKWYFPLITNATDLAVQNAWQINRLYWYLIKTNPDNLQQEDLVITKMFKPGVDCVTPKQQQDV